MTGKIKQLIENTKCSITLEINQHRDIYESVEQYMQGYPHESFIKDIEQEVYNKMVETDTIIELQVYPNTPISFYKIYGYDLDMVLDEALKD